MFTNNVFETALSGLTTTTESADTTANDLAWEIRKAVKSNAINTRQQKGARNSGRYMEGLGIQLTSDAEAIIAATTAAQKKFKSYLDFRLIAGRRDGECTVSASAGGITVTGHGLFYKQAKAAASRLFLAAIK